MRYLFLARTISDVAGCHVVLISSSDETAFAVRHALEKSGDGAATGPPREEVLDLVRQRVHVRHRLFGP